MKIIYLFASFLFFTTPAITQTILPNRPFEPDVKNRFLLKENKQPIILGYNNREFGIETLLHNNMPCFKPDVSLIAAMPCSKTILPNQFIPNPYFK